MKKKKFNKKLKLKKISVANLNDIKGGDKKASFILCDGPTHFLCQTCEFTCRTRILCDGPSQMLCDIFY